MSYYLLPHISNTLQCDDINIEMHDKLSNNICKTTHKYLSTLKKEIESHTDKWDIYKKFTNTYEYIHTQIPGVKQSISKYKPVSRAYFKFVEIVNIFNIIPDNRFTISTFHLCEGPGGFIEAICHLRNNHNDTFNGMTLIGVDDNIPGWKKNTRLLKNNPKIHLEYGHDNTGDIINYKNYLHTVNKFKNSMTIITGDGGFDFSSNFNNQESMSSKLILAQILYAISMQSYKGHFILKIFDIFFKSTIQLIYKCHTIVYTFSNHKQVAWQIPKNILYVNILNLRALNNILMNLVVLSSSLKIHIPTHLKFIYLLFLILNCPCFLPRELRKFQMFYVNSK
jgi:23S rRNA U2552 (ribose-2'-O)-methylase RlmE/FtsJ